MAAASVAITFRTSTGLGVASDDASRPNTKTHAGTAGGLARTRCKQIPRAVDDFDGLRICEMRSPRSPDGLGNCECAAGTHRMLGKLELEHHLIKRTFEDVRDVGTFHPFGQPSLIVLHGLGEVVLVHAQGVGKVADRVLIRAVEVHGLDFHYSEPVDVDCSVLSQRQFEDRHVEGEFRAVGSSRDAQLAAKLLVEIDEHSLGAS